MIKQALEKEFEIVKEGGNFGREQEGEYYVSVKNKKLRIMLGPPVKMSKFAEQFLAKHKNAIKKAGRWQAKLEPEKDAKEFLRMWAEKNKKMLESVGIVDVRID